MGIFQVLVELIVVLVILAILMAVLIPTLLGWIDKARVSQVQTNANAAMVATQSLLDERYGLGSTDEITKSEVDSLVDFQSTAKWSASFSTTDAYNTSNKETYKISAFVFTQDGTTLEWNISNGQWKENASATAGGHKLEDKAATPTT